MAKAKKAGAAHKHHPKKHKPSASMKSKMKKSCSGGTCGPC